MDGWMVGWLVGWLGGWVGGCGKETSEAGHSRGQIWRSS